ncbi:MAG: thiamine pyrophosphate-binding protein, partial [Pseudooceanicola atlanticus]
MKLFEALAQALAQNGDGLLFGVVGDANAYMVDAYARRDGTRYVALANETGAVLAAIGAAMVGDEVG